MATEEIEISQLELAEDLAPDMVLPVETPTKTFATTLEKIRQFFGLDNKTNLNMDNLNADGKSLISGLGMPSLKYDDLTLGASGSTYTAPADGWYAIVLVADGKWVNISTARQLYAAYHGEKYAHANFPVSKGETLKIEYDAVVTKQRFLFIYANGENN